MHVSSTILYRMLVTVLGAILVLGLLLTISSSNQKANALDATEWQKVAGSLDGYIDSQYVATDDGEAGYVMTAAVLESKLDSNNDGIYLGEGDDAAARPVIVDVLGHMTNMIPGTSHRTWPLASPKGANSADSANAAAVKAKVQAQRDAGFSDDIINYCKTGHGQSPVVMSYGAMSQAGYFDDPGTPGVEKPIVTGLKWGRQGWNFNVTGAPSYLDTRPYSATPIATPVSALPTTASCAGVTPDSELVRCAADVALYATGHGIYPWEAVDDALYQPVDLRPGVVSYYMADNSGGNYAYSNPLQNLFDATGGTYSNLTKLDASKTSVFVNRTQHSAEMAAQGVNMLGGDALALRFGLPRWNSSTPPNWPEQNTGGPTYTLLTVTGDGTGPDIVAPAITAGPSAAPSSCGAVITWTTDEPATSMVEWSTTSGGPYTTVNDTVLHASHTVNLSGLPESTTIYYRVSSYDGTANGVTSAEGSFTTAAASKPVISQSLSNVYWASMADYTAGVLSIDYTITNNGSGIGFNVKLTGSSANNGVTVSSGLPASVGTLGGGGGSGNATVKYNVPTGVGSFVVNNTASADDGCGNGYTYP